VGALEAGGGEVPLGDDREPLWVDQEALAAMVAHFQERGLDLVVDNEHQTLSGHKAPAAGWIKELEAREDGLWARMEWTATTRDHLAVREHRYFSPVLRLEDKTRRPLALLACSPHQHPGN
jgi:phage I-like protein